MFSQLFKQGHIFGRNTLRRLHLRHKIWLGVLLVLLLGALVSISFYSALKITDSALHRVTNEEEPIAAAAYGMSINVANSGTTVVNYLRTGDSMYQDDAQAEKIAFNQVHERYRLAANNAEEREFAEQVLVLHNQYWELADQLIAARPNLEITTNQTLEYLELTESLLDEAVAKVSSRASSAGRRIALQSMQLSLTKLSKELQSYLRIGLIQSSQTFSDEAEQFLIQLGYYQNENLGRIETGRANELSKLFDQSHDLIRTTVVLHDSIENQLQELYQIRERLNTLVSKKMVPVAQRDLEQAKFAAETATEQAINLALLVGPLLLILSLLVVWMLIRSITYPAKQLYEGAAAIGEGDLDYRIPNLGHDELGLIGRQFNRMTEKLKKTTVKRDRLEMSEAALRKSQERYERAMSGTNDGLFDYDLTTDEVYFSPRIETMLGYSPGEVIKTTDDYYQLVHPNDIELFRHNLQAYVGRPGEYMQHEYRIKQKDGTYRWVLCRGVVSRKTNEANETSSRFSGSQTDIHAQKQAEQQLIHDAMHDRLTGLPNRHLLLDRLQHFLDSKERRKQERAGLLFLDLDGFKMINDSLGHAAGDRLLIALAHRLQKMLKPEDTLARFGGDEFVILTEGIQKNVDIERLAEELHEALELPFVTGNGKTFLGASVGIALADEQYQRAEDLLRDADIAMYRAKSQGKKRHVLFDKNMHSDVVGRLQLENELRHAFEHDQFEIFYQPIIDLQDSRKLVGFEALIRWRHPERGLISPETFIPLLEESGLIIDVGEWMLSKACSTVKTWHRKNYTPWVSINVSAVQLRDNGLVASVARALEDSQLAPQYLTLEITESNVMKNETLARSLLKKVKQLGIKLSMDDFGVGYSSLSYLKRFPWDYVKIDRSFVHDIAHDPEAASIMEAIIVMVHTLKFDVVAEGIETVEQLEVLRDYGIDCVQGYLLSRPENAEAWQGLTSISSKKFLKNAFAEKSNQVSQSKA